MADGHVTVTNNAISVGASLWVLCLNSPKADLSDTL
jgi:hypothetical protein